MRRERPTGWRSAPRVAYSDRPGAEQALPVMVLIRYTLYFFGVAFVTWALTQLEISSPGGLRLQVFTHVDDRLGTSEFSPVEMLQPAMLLMCGLMFAWVAQHCLQQRPVALIFGGVCAIFTIREMDYFADRMIVDNFWQAPAAVIAALTIVYGWRHRKRAHVAWARMWPSPGLTLIFAGALVHFAFAPFVGHEPLWQAALGDDYRRVVKLAVEEFIELIGYFLWLIGTAEYWWQARAQAEKEPPPASRRRGRRRGEGRY